ncbi:myosin-11 isoform X5 [Drosophila willistoni]|uniref:myosin-11 isoform X5 n=1 Tax=Drosophila willistoni TaxID=7260 RepID=UPI000C26C634|nr:myosin-11 isoform X5 [Drosophila willistoni]
MDLRSWKKVLLEWVKECNFLKKSFRTLEESDLEAFFEIYLQQDEVTLMFQQKQQEKLARKYSSSQHLSLLATFLRSIYPDFNPHLEKGVVVGSDYLYVYTLLMHYACVKNPTEVFHSICKRLPDRTQECIAKFFEQTVEKPQLSREELRQAIVNVSVVYRRGDTESPQMSENRSRRQSTCGSPKSLNTSTSSNRSLNSNDSILEIPEIKQIVRLPEDIPSPPPPDSTPVIQQRMQSRTQVPPPTPKSEMLELQNRELLGLRAELQTKDYENIVLEEQIMETKHLVASLIKVNNEKQQQLDDLKASVQNEEEGNGDMHNHVPNEIEHLKRSLGKEIAQKENVITEMSDRIQDLQSENCELTSKLKISETHLNVCMDRIGELETRLDETSEALNIRTEELNCLERDKKELEECLQQTRDELHQRREILNSSSDLLDTSITASTGSHNITPENLATSVIDKQLREKQLQNDELESQLQTMIADRKKWSEKLKGLLQHFYESLDIDEVPTGDNLVLIEKTLSHLEVNWRHEQQRTMQLEQLRDKQSVTQAQLRDRIQESNSKVKKLEQMLSQAQQDCQEHNQRHKLELEQSRSQHIKEMNDLQEKLEHEATRLEAHQKQFDNLLFRYDELHANAAEADHHLCQVRQEMAEKEQQIGQVGAELLQLRSKNQAHEERIDSLVTERSSEKQRSEKQIDELNKQIEDQERAIKHVRCKYKQCRKELNLHSGRMDQLITVLLQADDWDEAIAKVDALVKYKAEMEEKYTTEIASLEERLHDAMCMSVINEQQISDLREELALTTERWEDQRNRYSEFRQQVQTDLHNREAQLEKTIMERQASSDAIVINLRERLRNTRLQLERFLNTASKFLRVPRDDDGLGGGDDQDNVDQDGDDGIDSESDSDSSGSRLTVYQNRIDEVTARIERNMCSRKQLLESIDEKTAEINELTKQHALAITANQQWTARVKQEQEANSEQMRVAMAEKDEELDARDQRISGLQDELSEERSRVEQLMAKLAKTMEKMESQDIAAIEMVASLNNLMANNSVTSTMQCQTPPPTASSSELSWASTNFSQLRNRLLHFEAGFEQLESNRRLLDEQLAEASREASDLASAKVELERQVVSLEEKLKIQNDLVNCKMANQLEHLNCSLQNMEEANEKLSADNERLQSLLSELEETRSESQVQMAALQAELDQRNEQLADLQQTLQSKADEIESVQKQFEEKAKVSNQVNVEHEQRLQLVHQLKDDLEVLRNQSLKSTQQRDDANFAVERQQNEIRRLEQHNTDTLTQLEQANAEKERLEQERKESEAQVVQRDEQIAKLNNDLKESELRIIAEKTESDQQLKILRHEMDLVQQKWELSLQTKSAMTEEIESLTTKLKQQSELVVNGEKELEKLQLEITKEQEKTKELELQMAKLEEEKKAFEEQKGRLQAQLGKNKEQIEKNHDQSQLLRQELSKEQMENERLQQETSRLEDELQNVKSQIEKNHDQSQELSKEQMENERLQQETSRLEDELQNAKSQIEKNHDQSQELSKEQMENERLQKETSRLEDELQNAKSQIEKNHDQSQLLRQELSKEQMENERLQQETSRLEDELQYAKTQLETNINRNEKMAVKLGELQSSHIKKQNELDQRNKAQAETIVILQQEKDHMLKELGQLNDRLSKTEQREAIQMKQSQEAHSEAVAEMRREIESLQQELNEAFTNLYKSKTEAQTRIESLQEQLDGAQLLKQNAEIERATCNERLSKLEKLRESQEKNIRHLNHQLSTADEVKVQLNYEIGGLNSEIEQHKRKMTEVNAQLQESIEAVGDLQMQLKAAQSERDQGKKEIAELSDKLSELRQEVVGNRLIHECELEEKTRELEIERQETAERIAHYQTRVDELQQQLAERNQELNELNTSRNDLCATYTKNSDQETNARELALEQLQQERSVKQQLELDCQILQAKYREAKEEVIRCEQKIKDQRLEMEGKLEKMKNKMVQTNLSAFPVDSECDVEEIATTEGSHNTLSDTTTLIRVTTPGTSSGRRNRSSPSLGHLLLMAGVQAFFLGVVHVILYSNETDIELRSRNPTEF